MIVRASIFALFMRATGLVLSLVATVAAARVLGPDNFGTYSFLIVLCTLGAAVGALGTPQWIIREIGRLQAEGRSGIALAIVQKACRPVLAVSLLAGAAIGLAYFAVQENLHSQSALLAFIVVVAVSAASTELLFAGAMRGIKRPALALFGDAVLRPVLVLSILAAFFLLAIRPSVGDLLFGYILASACAIAIFALRIRGVKPGEAVALKDLSTRTLLLSATPFLAFTAAQLLMDRGDLVALGFLSEPRSVGLYRSAAQLAGMLSIVLVTIGQAIAPLIAESARLSKRGEIQHTYTRSTRLAICLTLPPAIVFISFPQDVVTLVFGEAYSNASLLLRTLTVMHFINCFVGPTAIVLIMADLHWQTLYLSIGFALLMILLCIGLIPSWGAMGAAVAALISITGWNVGLGALAWLQLGVCVGPFGFRSTQHQDG